MVAINSLRFENVKKNKKKARRFPNNRALMGRGGPAGGPRPVNQLLTCADKTTIHHNVQLMGSSSLQLFTHYDTLLHMPRLKLGVNPMLIFVHRILFLFNVACIV